jgi:hypothetical protein
LRCAQEWLDVKAEVTLCGVDYNLSSCALDIGIWWQDDVSDERVDVVSLDYERGTGDEEWTELSAQLLTKLRKTKRRQADIEKFVAFHKLDIVATVRKLFFIKLCYLERVSAVHNVVVDPVSDLYVSLGLIFKGI